MRATRPLLLGALLAASLADLPAAALDTAARTALVVEHLTGAVLLEKNADMPVPPASMSKLMTLNMLFEALADGRLGLEDQFRVSKRAAEMGGSKMFLSEGSRVRVADLIRGIIVQSGNDACVVVAEGLAGSEEAFARKMNERAPQIGLRDSHFTNASGWPEAEHRMSARDLVTLARRMIRDFPQFYPYFAETEFTWEGIVQKNRNPLLFIPDMGADGLKTGHTEEAGFGLVGSALRDGQRVVFMIAGLGSMREREEEAERLVSWAFREFRNVRLYEKGAVLAEAEVWLGDAATVPLVAPRDILATLPWGDGQVSLRVVYAGPVPAPIAEGAEIGRLVIEAAGLKPVEVPLVAGRAVEAGGYLVRLEATARALATQVIGAD
jgi:D-alanyl-D-alanine carboxypeptidase (penicillin-binding protein 5/6)